MRRLLGVIAIIAGNIGATHAARAATTGWTQLPGLATQIAVGATDIPYILDINNNIQYLSPSTRNWVSMNIQATHVSADLYGYLWYMDANNSLMTNVAVPLTQSDVSAFPTIVRSASLTSCVTSLAPGHEVQFPSQWNYPFGFAAQPIPIPPVGRSVTYGTESTYFVDCGTHALSDITPLFTAVHATSTQYFGFWEIGVPFQVDTPDLQVAQFTVDGSANQVPWGVHTAASGVNVADAFNSNGATYASAPSILGFFFSIQAMTDHYVVAGSGGNNAVFKWMGNAFGGGPNAVWSYLSGSQSVPGGGHVVQIAYASALPGTSVGTVGPSHLYMIDSNNNIYQWGS